MKAGKRVALRFSGFAAIGVSLLRRLIREIPRLFGSQFEMRLVRIECNGQATVTSIFFLQRVLETAGLKTYYIDVDRAEMRLYADVLVETAAEMFSTELLIARLSKVKKKSKRNSLN